MKKLGILITVVTLLVISAVPAFAAGGPPADRGTGCGNCTGDQIGMGSNYQASMGNLNQTGFGVRLPYALSGTIIALDPTATTITVEVYSGNRLMKDYLDTAVTLETMSITRFLLRNDDGSATPISFEELEVGQTVSSHGTLVDGVFTATRVTMGAVLDCLP
jgi:hypothetical protein